MSETNKSDNLAKALKRIAKEGAADIDKHLGRTAAPERLGQFADIEPGTIVPTRVREHPGFKRVNKTVGLSATAVKLIAFFGQGSMSAVVASATRQTTVGSYDTFYGAFTATLALSASTTLFSYMWFRGHMKSYGAVLFWVLATLFIVGFTRDLGYSGPDIDKMASAVRAASNPLAKAAVIMGQFLEAYTVLPFLSGLVVGTASGWMISEAEGRKQA